MFIPHAQDLATELESGHADDDRGLPLEDVDGADDGVLNDDAIPPSPVDFQDMEEEEMPTDYPHHLMSLLKSPRRLPMCT